MGIGSVAQFLRFLFFLVLAGGSIHIPTAVAAEGGPVSDFSLPSLSGSQVRLSQYQGKVVVISFWATWCKPCAQELDFLQELYANQEGDDLVVLAISTDGPETFAEVRAFVKRKGWTMPVLLDPEGMVAAVLNPRFAQPFSVYIDRMGSKVSEQEGFSTGDIPKITAKIEGLLAQSAEPQGTQEIATSTSFTNRFVTEIHGDNQNGGASTLDDHYGLTFNQLNGLVTHGDLSFQFRFNSWFFSNPPVADQYVDAERFSDNLERISWQYQVKGMTLTGGDFYQQFGRGIALSIRKADETGLDRAVRGARYRYSGERFQFTGFAGAVNARNIDAISQKFVEDPHDVLAGTSLELRPVDGTKIGLFALSTTVTERSTVHDILGIEENDHSETFGGFLEFSGLLDDKLSLYLEADIQNRTKLGEEEEGAGKAGYLVADLNLGSYTLLFEGLYMDAFEQRGSTNTALSQSFEYNQPPTLERIDQEVFNNRDVAGARLRLEGSFLNRKLVTYVNAMLRMMEPYGVQPVRQLHGFVGAEYLYDEGRSRLGFSAGYRVEHNLDELDGVGGVFSQAGEDFKATRHFDLDYLQDLKKGLALHLLSTVELRSLTSPTAEGLTTHDYIRGSTFLGLEVSQFGGLTFEFGYDTQKSGPGVANYFLAGILAAELNHSSSLRVTAGTQRGGLKCIAGVCRDYPGFSGLKAEWIARF